MDDLNDNQKGLLSARRLGLNDLRGEGHSCKLCDTVLYPDMTDHHIAQHITKFKTLHDSYTSEELKVNACRLNTLNCPDSSGHGRFHFHCPTCSKGFRSERIQKHYNACSGTLTRDKMYIHLAKQPTVELDCSSDDDFVVNKSTKSGSAKRKPLFSDDELEDIDSARGTKHKLAKSEAESKFIPKESACPCPPEASTNNGANDKPLNHVVKKSRKKIVCKNKVRERPIPNTHLLAANEQKKEYVPCVYCEDGTEITRGQMSTHIRRVHGKTPHLPGTIIDAKNQIYLIRKGVAGSAKPIHVKFSPFRHNSGIFCPDRKCKDFARVAQRLGQPGVLCRHLESVKYAQVNQFPPVTRDTINQLDLSENKKESLERLIGKAFADHDSPLIVLMAYPSPKPPNCLYFSVYDPQAHGKVAFNRVITTLNVKERKFSCDCGSKMCIHLSITQGYIRQIHPSLVIEPTTIIDHGQEDTNDKTVEDTTTPAIDLSKTISQTSDMINYLLECKKVPFRVNDFDKISEKFTKREFIPVETECFRCKVPLGAPILISNRAYIYTTCYPTVKDCETYMKRCPDCGLAYRYQEFSEGVHNYNDNTLVSIKFLEGALCNRYLAFPLNKYIKSLEKGNSDLDLNYDVINDALNHYKSLKDYPFTMCCGVCGNTPDALIFDADRKVAFDLSSKDKESATSPEAPSYSSYDEFFKDVCKQDLAAGLTSDPRILKEFKLKVSRNWLPFLGKGVVTEHQPQTSRDAVNLKLPSNPFPISWERLTMLAHDDPRGLKLDALCRRLGLSTSKLNREQKMASIINADLCYDNFCKEFFSLTNKSGGVLRGMCTHGITYVFKPLVECEGPSDYAQAILSIPKERRPSVMCIDFAPQVARYTNALEHVFFPYGGALAEKTLDNIQQVENGNLLNYPDLDLEDEYRDRSKWCLALIDKFHEVNHRQIGDQLHYIDSCKQLKHSFNSERVEQENGVLNTHTPSLNNERPDRHVKSMVFFVAEGNYEKNKDLIDSRWGPNIIQCPKTGKFIKAPVLGASELDLDKCAKTSLPAEDKNSRQLSPTVKYVKKSPPKFPPVVRPNLKVTLLKAGVLLQNSRNNCWLTTCLNTLTYAGILDDLFNQRQVFTQVDQPLVDILCMLSTHFDHQTYFTFYNEVLENMRFEKVTLSEVNLYVSNAQIDAFEALMVYFFPRLEDAGINFRIRSDLKYLTVDNKETTLSTVFSAAIFKGAAPDYVFVRINRPSVEQANGRHVISTDSYPVQEYVETSHFAYRLATVACFTGSTTQGHWSTLVYDSEEYLYYVLNDDQKTVVLKERFLDLACTGGSVLLYRRVERGISKNRRAGTEPLSETFISGYNKPSSKKRPREKTPDSETDSDPGFSLFKPEPKKKKNIKPEGGVANPIDVEAFLPPPPTSTDNSTWCVYNSKSGRQTLYLRDYKRLSPGKWFNDSIIDCYMSMLHVQSSGSYGLNFVWQSVLDPHKWKNLVGNLKFIQPIRVHGDHWILLSNINVKEKKTIYIYDSLHHFNSKRQNYDYCSLSKVLETLMPGVNRFCLIDVLQQNNQYDCGPLCLFSAWCLSKGRDVNTTQAVPLEIRRKVATSFESNQLCRLTKGTFEPLTGPPRILETFEDNNATG